MVLTTQTNTEKETHVGILTTTTTTTTTMMDCTTTTTPLPVDDDAVIVVAASTRSSSPGTAKIELRKRLKLTTTDWTNRKQQQSTRRLNNNSCSSSKISTILQSNNNDDNDDSDDGEDEDNDDAVMAKRSCCESIMSSSSSSTAAAAGDNGGTIIFDGKGISPIDNAPTTSIKDMNLDYLLSWDPTKRPPATNTVGVDVVVGSSSSSGGVEDTDDKMTTTTTKKTKTVTIVEDVPMQEKSSVTKNSTVAPKITRNDLAYMMNWNPFDKVEEKVDGIGCSSRDGDGDAVGQRSTINSAMTTIDEAHEEGTNTLLLGDGVKITSSQEGESADNNNNNNNDVLANEEVEACSKRIGSSSVEGVSIYEDKTVTTSSSSHESKEEKVIMIPSSTLDRTFLPLIEKKNIIHVENVPYVKLGVIGKGGSCKVYRALSRDCTVVALKKVKLDGLNQLAIDGYANEIALLKRLQGNPAIIQLYSAEVDLDRKSILLVMELGEVDLNYVLRQQALSSSKQQQQQKQQQGSRGGVSSLNMNFIRLTWQQMLTAVHSIHEERIIHSDLKPANFLFVKGALKLIDFGIAKAIERDDTTNVYRETLSGTLSYMSPEAIMDTSTNAKGERVNRCGRPSDIWSLGCILYQMVYGKTPFADYVGIPQKVLAITNVKHEIHFPDGVDESSMDAMRLCLQRDPKLRPPIIGVNGLLNEHCFLHGKKRNTDQR
jgi:serine/threonine-protein kinase RIO1